MGVREAWFGKHAQNQVLTVKHPSPRMPREEGARPKPPAQEEIGRYTVSMRGQTSQLSPPVDYEGHILRYEPYLSQITSVGLQAVSAPQ